MIRQGVVVWVTGKPSSGKSTLAERLHASLKLRGAPSVLLDGDAVRGALRPEPGYTPEARDAFYATLANLAALFAQQGSVVIVAATAHARTFRDRARSVAPSYLEVWVKPAEGLPERRDSKGLYRAAREGRTSDVPGADLSYEEPPAADVVASGGLDDGAITAILGRLGF